MTVISPIFFFGKCNCNNDEIYIDFHTFSIMRLLFYTVSLIFNTLLPTSIKTLHTSVVKFPVSTSEHIAKTLSIRCQQNGVQVVHPLQGQTGGSRTGPQLGCEQDGEEQSITFLRLPHVCASRCEVGHCREGEGPLSCFGYDELYGCVVAVCLKFPCTTRDVLRSGGREF
jgi:hypothetical protein